MHEAAEEGPLASLHSWPVPMGNDRLPEIDLLSPDNPQRHHGRVFRRLLRSEFGFDRWLSFDSIDDFCSGYRLLVGVGSG